MKQIGLFGDSFNGSIDGKYSNKIEPPVYEPKGKKPHLFELCDKNKSQTLIQNIKNSSIPDDEKDFLIEASKRHLVFNFEKIAEYYAQSSKEMQVLMEQSALVIIDFYDAIGYGFVKMCKDIKKQYLNEYAK